jgi:hypothetical protein
MLSKDEIQRVNKENLEIFNNAASQSMEKYGTTERAFEIAKTVALMTVITENTKSICRVIP